MLSIFYSVTSPFLNRICFSVEFLLFCHILYRTKRCAHFDKWEFNYHKMECVIADSRVWQIQPWWNESKSLRARHRWTSAAGLSNSCRSITCVTCNTNTVYNIVPPPFKQPLSLFDSRNHFLLIILVRIAGCFLLFMFAVAIRKSTTCSSDMYSVLTERDTSHWVCCWFWSGSRETSFKAALEQGVSAVG